MNYLEKNIENFKKDLKELISFETWLSSNEYPNSEMKKALQFFKRIADRDGMKCYIDKDGYYGYIDIGEGEELIGILAHIDVVPPGKESEWNSKPFELTEKDGKLFGRGTSDDKGPLLLSYYLLKELKDKKINKRIRLIFPTDEETFWRGIDKYNEKEEKPTYGFTPDSSFPVTFLEREILHLEIHGKGFEHKVVAGTAPNVVPNEAKLIYSDGKEITAKGKSAHAMHPHTGDNAIYNLVKKLDDDIKHPIFDFIKKEINFEYHGEKLFDKLIKDDYAKQTVNLGIIDMNPDGSKIVLDMRIPTTATSKELTKIIEEKAKKHGLVVSSRKQERGVYFQEEYWMIKDMVDSVNTILKKKIKPQASGGGTYAKAIDTIVAFGPMMPGSEHTEHQANEYIVIKDFIKAYDIYRHLIDKWLEREKNV